MEINAKKSNTFYTVCCVAVLLAMLAGQGCQRRESQATIVDDDVWEVLNVQGAKVGYQHTVTQAMQEQGRAVRQINTEAQMTLSRDGQPIVIKLVHKSTETPDGQLLRYSTETRAGPSPMSVKAYVAQGRLVIETETAGKVARESVPWPADARGFQGAEQSLMEKPMQPSERRKLLALVPEFNQAGNIELIARDYEATPLLDGSENLLRIENHITVNGQELPQAALWTDRQGRVKKARSEMLQMETYRTTKEVAQAVAPPGNKFDLWNATFVQPDRSLPRPHDTRTVRYEVHLDGDDPAKVFATGPTQSVKPIDSQTAEITVRAIRPTDPATVVEDTPAGDDDRVPNSLIQSDSPKVIALARQAAPDETDPWRIALALEELVHRKMEPRDLSQGFATAADVAEGLSGDCTEYGVLLAGLARARGIPARVAVGLVYTSQGFGFHMWTEVWIRDRWIPLDGTLGRGGIGAAHLKLATSNLKGVSAFTGFIPVAQVLGRLKIKILSVDDG
jgi:hypothetical protein